MAASATFALKAGVWFRRGRLVMGSPDSRGTACPLSGRNSTYRPVQISGAGSVYSAASAILVSTPGLVDMLWTLRTIRRLFANRKSADASLLIDSISFSAHRVRIGPFHRNL